MECIELMIRYRNGDCTAFNELFEVNKKLIYYISKKHEWMLPYLHYDFDDLLQEAYIIFAKCISDYDVSSDYKFSTYLGNSIHWGLTKLFNNATSAKHYNKDNGSVIQDISLEQKFNEDQDLLSILSDPRSEAEIKLFIEKEFNDQLKKDTRLLLNHVFDKKDNGSKRVKYIIQANYGIDQELKNVKELSISMNCSYQNICRLRSKGIRMIKNSQYGKSYMEKYKSEYFGYLINKKECLKETMNPKIINNKLDDIDKLINSL